MKQILRALYQFDFLMLIALTMLVMFRWLLPRIYPDQVFTLVMDVFWLLAFLYPATWLCLLLILLNDFLSLLE